MLKFLDEQSEPQETLIADASGKGSWAGKPGQFSDKWLPQNAIDAVNKAGASVLGIKNANPNDVKLIEKFYGNPENNAVLNQYDLSTNLFLRYLSGRGAEGLEFSPEQGKKILSAIKKQEKNKKDRGGFITNNMWVLPKDTQESFVYREFQGEIPVYFGGGDSKTTGGRLVDTREGRDELTNSLGSFWAKPDGKGGYTIEETYNFQYGKNNPENGRNKKQQKDLERSTSMSLKPANAGRTLAIKGYGKAYKYKLHVDRNGKVTSIPVSDKN